MTRKPRSKPAPKTARVCNVAGCTATRTYTRGLCALHWCTRADLADPMPPPVPGRWSLKTGIPPDAA